MSSSNDPSQTIPAVDAMREDWAIVAPLMGGTSAMRNAAKALLPQYPAEEDDAYAYRLETGYSTQAPLGMAGVTAAEFQTFVNQAVRELDT